MGKRFDVLDKELETLSKLRIRQSTLPFVDMVFFQYSGLCKNTANTGSVDEANDFLRVCPGVRVNEGIAIVVSLFRSHCFFSFLL